VYNSDKIGLNYHFGGIVTSTTALEEEYFQVYQLYKQTLEFAQQNRQALPAELTSNLTQIYNSLVRMGSMVKRDREEHANIVALTEISQVVNSSLEINEVLRIVMDTIIRLTRAERGFLMLRNEQGEFKIRTARNWEQESIDSLEAAISSSVVNRVVSDGQPVLTTNAQEDPRFSNSQSIMMHNLRSILCVPLRVKGEITGVIYTDNRFASGIFSESNRNLLTTFADQAAIALENARLFESVRLTLIEVTGLKNLMDNVFASIASGVITTDMHDQILLCNQAARSIIGSLQRDLAGDKIQQVCELEQNGSEFDRLFENISQVRKNGSQIVGLELNPVLKERGTVNLSFNLSPLKGAGQDMQGVAIVMNDLTETKRLEGQRRLFERMVSPAVINQLNPDQLQLGGKRSKITVLFADVRGFTKFSERLSPEELVEILNVHLAAVADSILAHAGTIDKFMGDAVMAWYNAPIPQPDHAMRAMRSAIEVRNNLIEIQSRMPAEAQLSFGMGIHYGDAVLGLVGTERRMEYTAIGDSVNTAKRIQENCSAGQILISSDVYELVKSQVAVQPVDPLSVKGKSRPLAVYELLSVS
jgi:adenylate cyclase